MSQTVQRPPVENIPPHGGQLVDLLVEADARRDWSERAAELARHTLSQREQCDLELLAVGGMSPLRGFMTEEDYRCMVDDMRLADGTIWPLPVTLAVAPEQAGKLKEGSDLALYDSGDQLLAVLHVESIFQRSKEHEAREVFRTGDTGHPGVAHLHDQPEVLVGGPLSVLATPQHEDLTEFRLAPANLRALFVDRGWRRVVGFQTRNPMHRAHEYLTKCALEISDGLLLHPLVGETKADDVPADIRMRSYRVMLDEYFPQDRTVLAVLEASMRYAGPREAIFHALIRKNYGCTHFIVGRDHAGVGDYYGTYDAQHIFDEFPPEDIGITPLFFEHTFFCRKCDGMVSFKTCACDRANHVFLSGSKVRSLLESGESPPSEITRPEVAAVLIEGYQALAGK